jgi:two-component system response regulator FixJ
MGNDIYIVDDDEAIRDSLKTLLEAHGFSIHLYSDGERFLEADLMGILGPVLLDVRMPGRNGLDVLEEALIANKTLKIIVMSGHADVAMAVMALKKGALDFIEKPFQASELLKVIGRLNTQIQDEQQASVKNGALRQKIEKLTPREREVMSHLVHGKPNKIVAADLELSVRTVETHRAHLFSKLEIRSISELVRIAIETDGTVV